MNGHRGSGAGAAFAVAALAIALWAPGAHANTFTVTTTADNGDNNNPPAGSLRAAVINSNGFAGPDVIDATGVSGSIELEGELRALTDEVAIRGPGASMLTVRRAIGAPSFRIFHVHGSEVELSALTIARGRFTGSSDGGGGILNFVGTLTLRNAVVTGNSAVGTANGADGGGISNFGAMTPAELTLIDSLVEGNTSAGSGAGIRNRAAGEVTLVRSTVAGNASGGGAGCAGGGGVQTQGPLTILDSTISRNFHPDRAGGVLVCGPDGSATIARSTLASNEAPSGANLLVLGAGGTAMLESAILADPLGGGQSCEVGGGAVLTSNGHNLADDASCALNGPADQPAIDPQLEPLADNGGPTPTHALAPSSPAVDAGISDGTRADQRGLPRPVDLAEIANASGGEGADVGAFERQPSGSEPSDATPPGVDVPRPEAGPAAGEEPSNRFRIKIVRKKKRKGTAVLVLRVPSAGKLALTGNRKLERTSKRPSEGGRVKLPVRPRGKAQRRLSKQRLRERGKSRARVKVRARVAYRPTEGTKRVKTMELRLVRRVG